MKLIIVTAVRECKKTVADIFHEAGLYKFSVVNMHGVNSEHADNPVHNWFGTSDTEMNSESVMLFCFTNNMAAAHQTLAALKQYNQDTQPDFPIRAILVPVEEIV
jgi:Zn-dependent membrane protease YugP